MIQEFRENEFGLDCSMRFSNTNTYKLNHGWVRGESVFNEVPWGVVRKAPDKSLTAWGRAETSAPFPVPKTVKPDAVAAASVCLGQSSKHSCESWEDMIKI